MTRKTSLVATFQVVGLDPAFSSPAHLSSLNRLGPLFKKPDSRPHPDLLSEILPGGWLGELVRLF